MNYSLYTLATGLFTGVQLSCTEAFLDMNVPSGQSCVLGSHDWQRQKVDSNGLVVDYQPPSPGPNYVWDVPTLAWVYVPTDEDLAFAARARRDNLLAASDWVTLRAFRTSTPIPTAWLNYQTALADLPTQPGFPRDIIWPTPPNDKEP